MPTAALLHCLTCGAENHADARICGHCARVIAAEHPVQGAERKQVSVLFSDLTGFTALSERLDPEDTRQILASVFGAAAEIVAKYEGRIEKFVGDAIMAIFGVPAAHEDDPVRALRAAIELHDAVARLSPGVQARTGVAIALHSAVNTGVVVTGEQQFGSGTAGPLGDTINLAARLMSEAPSGEIWVGPQTRLLAELAFEFDDLGEQSFKGKAQPVAVARLLGLRARRLTAINHFRASFVGREVELGALLGATEQLRAGAPQALGVRGDAGTGKTRLMSECRDRVGTDIQWLEARAYPYAQNIPYAPLIDLFSRTWGIEERDSPATVRAKLEVGLAPVAHAGHEILPLLLHLYQLEQAGGVVIERESFPSRLLAAMRSLLAVMASRAPTIVCLQDLHWIDQSTDALLRALISEPPPAVFLLANFRPSYRSPPGMKVVDLGDLSAGQTRELLASLLQAEPPDALTHFIAERSDGNPFYVEEVINTLVETHTLVRVGDGWRLERPLAEAGVPATVRGVIAARIDRLDDVHRGVLRHAAVVGRNFLCAVVTQVCSDAAVVAPSLTQLQAADLIRQRRNDPELEYTFKHALTQDVAYDGLLRAERHVLHARTAQVMEAVFADRLPEFVEILAYHYLRGGITDKAILYLCQAGHKCVQRYALVEADNHFRAAYTLIQKDARSVALSRIVTELLIAWSQVLYYKGVIGEWRRLLEAHLADAERCGEPSLQSLYMGWLGNVRSFHGDMRGSGQILARGRELAVAAGARASLAHLRAWLGFTRFDLEGPAFAIEETSACDMSAAEIQADPYPHFKAQCARALALAYSGELQQSRRISEEVIAFGRDIGNARAESLGQFTLSMHWLLALDFERAALCASDGVMAAKDPSFAACNAVPLATALIASLHIDEAAAVCEKWLPYLERSENIWLGLMLHAVDAAVRLARGDLSTGLRDALRSQVLAQERGYRSTSVFIGAFIMLTYVSIVRRDLKPPLSALLRNPWFTLTQAPFAARTSRRLMAELQSDCVAFGLRGLANLLDLGQGRLLAQQGRADAARACVARVRNRLSEVAPTSQPMALSTLSSEIDAIR